MTFRHVENPYKLNEKHGFSKVGLGIFCPYLFPKKSFIRIFLKIFWLRALNRRVFTSAPGPLDALLLGLCGLEKQQNHREMKHSGARSAPANFWGV